MTKGPEMSRIDHAHVMIAAERHQVSPLLQIGGVGTGLPFTLDIEQRTERAEMKPVGTRSLRGVRPTTELVAIVPRHAVHQHLAIDGVQRHAERLRVIGDLRARRLVDGVIIRPDRADAAFLIRAGAGVRRREMRMPELVPSALHAHQRLVFEACRADG